jgi:hypothetical protein
MSSPLRRIGVGILVALGALILLTVGGIFVLTNTPWGHERVRGFVVDQLNEAIQGEAEIGRIDGNLLTGGRLYDVMIIDSDGRPFVRAAEIAWSHSILGLLRQRIVLTRLELSDARVVLDRRPDQEWNYVRIFDVDSEAEPAPEPGWGHWVELRDIRADSVEFTLRMPWEPASGLSAGEREEKVRQARAGETVARVVEEPEGLQSVMEFSIREGRFPRVLVAHPDTSHVPVEIATLSGTAHPFRTADPGVIEDLSVTLLAGPDSLVFEDLTLVLPSSHLEADGRAILESGAVRFSLRADPITLSDFRFIRPDLAEEISADLVVAVDVDDEWTWVNARHLDARIGDGRVEGRGEVGIGNRIAIDDMDVRFDGIRTRFLEEALAGFAADLEFPHHGELEGRIVASTPSEDDRSPVSVVANVAFEEESGGTSRFTFEGGVTPGTDTRLHRFAVRMQPLRSELVRGLVPDVALRGEIEGDITLDGPIAGPLQVDAVLAHRDPVVGTSRLSGRGEVAFADEIRISGGVLDLDPLRLDLFRENFAHIPSGSTMRGFVRADGAFADWLEIESDLRVDDPATGTGRLQARGALRPSGEVAFREFHLAMDSIPVGLLRAFDPELPVSGVVQARAQLDGVLEQGLHFDLAMVHDGDEGGRSSVSATGEVATAGDGWARAALQVHELALPVVGRFVPEAELQGRVSGTAGLEGTFRDLSATLAFDLPGSGGLEGSGWMDATGIEPLYDFEVRLDAIDLAELSARIDEATSIGGTARGRGRGTDPAEMTAELEVDLSDDEPEGAPRTLRAQVALDGGFLTADTLALHTALVRVDARGAFGLVDDRTGTMEFRAEVDSLRVLSPFLPAGAGRVAPRPAVREAAVEAREEELIEVIRAAQVEYLATGERPDVPAARELPRIDGVRRDMPAGRVEVSGTIEGHTGEFDVIGEGTAEELALLGHRAEGIQGAFRFLGVGGDSPGGNVELEGDGLLVGGFAYERAVIRAEMRSNGGQHGELALSLRQDSETHILVDSEFEIADDRGEVRVGEFTLQFADATYALLSPGRVRWTGQDVEVEEFALESNVAGGVRAGGGIPMRDADTGPGGIDSFELSIEAFELAHLAHLAQTRADLEGRLGFELDVTGSLERPIFEGSGGLTHLALGADSLPDVGVEFDYSDRTLTLDAAAEQAGRSVLVADARLPMNLGIVDNEEPGLLDEPLSVNARLDNFRLEGLQNLSGQIDDLVGRIDGHFTIEGTRTEADVTGGLDLMVPTISIEPLGLQINDLAGSLSLQDDILAIDSLVAYSRGPIRISGEADVSRLDSPAFDLTLEAVDARLMHTRDVQVQADADLRIVGPFERVEISGQVRTREGVIRIPSTNELAEPGPLDLEDPTLRARLDPRLIEEIDRLVATSPLLDNLQVDLDLQIDRGMWVRSTDINVELSTPPTIGPLHVRMNGIRPEDLRLDGTVQSQRGEYEFMGRRFNLSRGAVTFVGGATTDPLIRLTAEHAVQLPGREAFDIRIVLDGTLTDLETELESTAEPPISQTDLLSFVVFGRDAGSLLAHQGSSLTGQGSAGGPLVGAVASRAAQQFATVGLNAVLEELEGETARSFGLDVLDIRPAELPAEISTGEFVDLLRGTEIEAGRYLTSRLFVSGQARPTFVHPGARMDYETRHGWVWRVTWRPRFLPSVPTLGFEEPDRASVFGSLIFREWRF